MSGAKKVEVTWTVELADGEHDVTFTVEVTGRYVPAKTYGPPESCYPAEYPEAEVVAAEGRDGEDMLWRFNEKDLAKVCDEALEKLGNLEEDAREAADEDRWEARRERAWDR